MNADDDLPADDRDPDWPDDWPVPDGVEPGTSRRRGPKIAALTLTALVALGAGAGAVYLYQNGGQGSTPAAAPSYGTTAVPGRTGNGTLGSIMLLGQVRSVRRDFLTVGGGPIPEISAQVTSATHFTGSARSLAQVHVGDTVALQILESNAVAKVVSLQDPATAS
jgi:hypothetical protein